MPRPRAFLFFFFNATATTEIYTLSLHDALPISVLIETHRRLRHTFAGLLTIIAPRHPDRGPGIVEIRSEEHTSELQSRVDLVCRLLLEKKKKKTKTHRRPEQAEHGLKHQRAMQV